MLKIYLALFIILILYRIKRLVVAIRAKQDIRGELLFFALIILIMAGILYLYRDELMKLLGAGNGNPGM